MRSERPGLWQRLSTSAIEYFRPYRMDPIAEIDFILTKEFAVFFGGHELGDAFYFRCDRRQGSFEQLLSQLWYCPT